MKTIIKGLMVMLVTGFASDISAQAYQSAVGGRLGTFFTASYKTFINDNTAIEGIAGFDRRTESFLGVTVAGTTSFVVGAFYEIHNDLSLDGADFQWYYGFGAFAALGGGTGVIPSGIVGLEYTLSDTPVNFFIDVIPGLFIGEGGTDFQFNGTIGARYVINR